MRMTSLAMASLALVLSACGGGSSSAAPAPAPAPAAPTPPTTPPPQTNQPPETGLPFLVKPVAQFDEPWAMTFLPDGRLLVTEKKGKLKLYDFKTSRAGDIAGVPEVAFGGQGGLGDVVIHPNFAKNQWVYLSYAEAGQNGTSGAAIARAKLVLDQAGGGKLEDLKVIWRQEPKVEGQGHYSHRMAFGQDGHLWVSSGERQKFNPAQDMNTNLGKILRLHDDGTAPADNPFADRGGVAAQVWSLGHRSILGLAFDAQGRLWEHEMGPKGGDELNLIERGGNYGWPIVSNGDHYDGRDIPDHPTQPQFTAPVITWNPVISPAGFVIYSGDRFPGWKGSGFIGGLSSQSLVRIEFDGVGAREAERFDMKQRIREVEQGPEGDLWLLEDGSQPGGRLLHLEPRG
ncbi:PQQ-dependent sugar dehydrogenase [Pseudoxanthomonas composti]|uniref:PQQ-dependent sugar dehydrogenase n=1 Tax=Pseudoxanthomonas composti TaxID=2137479 RepID=A0A4Q1JWR6_9GAMM|nr:PQQ-dependent sugar dehydrogenase [Pseudoxanthomonas composti]RXR06615.1 PQQ-dependent sugar dehydrogenase [Pseudoxanthomonas composti]